MGEGKSGFEDDWKALDFVLEIWPLDYSGGRFWGKGVIRSRWYVCKIILAALGSTCIVKNI